MGNKLYVGNLPYQVRDIDLEQAFGQFGSVTSAKVMMERDTGRSKGFGFVEMGSDDEALAAVNGLNGQPLGGRNLVVNEARPMEPRPPGGGFGGPVAAAVALVAPVVVAAAVVSAVTVAAVEATVVVAAMAAAVVDTAVAVATVVATAAAVTLAVAAAVMVTEVVAMAAAVAVAAMTVALAAAVAIVAVSAMAASAALTAMARATVVATRATTTTTTIDVCRHTQAVCRAATTKPREGLFHACPRACAGLDPAWHPPARGGGACAGGWPARGHKGHWAGSATAWLPKPFARV